MKTLVFLVYDWCNGEKCWSSEIVYRVCY